MKRFNKNNLQIIYGPVMSRRFGASLGINIEGSRKNCSYNCLYCFRGTNRQDSTASLPGKADILKSLLTFLGSYKGDRFKSWTIAGNGEPTDNPQLPEIIEALVAMRNHFSPDAKLTLLTNGMGFLPERNIRFKEFISATHLLDKVYLKLDSAVHSTWQILNQPERGISFAAWFTAVRQLRAPAIQTILVRGLVDNTTPTELDALLACYRKLCVSAVKIETFHHEPADNRLKRVPPERIREIQKIVAEAILLVTAK